jgi:flavin-dependent trigonelline monooxygenase, reductase component
MAGRTRPPPELRTGKPIEPRGDSTPAWHLPFQAYAYILLPLGGESVDPLLLTWDEQMPQGANGFRKAMGLRAAGVTVVTTRDRDGDPRGLTATAVCSVSLAPPMILVCIDRTAECYEAFQEAEAFAVNLLRHDQEALSQRFARKESRKFEGISHRTGITGSPILTDVLAHVECRIQARYPGGDHTIVLGEVVGSGVTPFDEVESPLLHFRGAYARLTRPPSTDAS